MPSAEELEHRASLAQTPSFRITKGLAAHCQSFGHPRLQQWEDHGLRSRRTLKRDEKVVGAIGVSGGPGDQDHAAAAEAGAAAF